MKFRISESSNVIEFIGKDYESKKVINIVAVELNRCLEQIEIPKELNDWTLEFTLLYNCVKYIGVARKGKSIKSIKLKEVIIHIPIPNKDIVNWGVSETQIIREYKFDKRYIDELMVDFSNYTNRSDYIIDNARRAIHFALKTGITINGNKIIIKRIE